eukprot:1157772-Pelagomonas_calceolata.AAC.2
MGGLVLAYLLSSPRRCASTWCRQSRRQSKPLTGIASPDIFWHASHNAGPQEDALVFGADKAGDGASLRHAPHLPERPGKA